VVGKKIDSHSDRNSVLSLGLPADGSAVELDLQMSNSAGLREPADALPGFSLNDRPAKPSAGANFAYDVSKRQSSSGNRDELRQKTVAQAARLNQFSDSSAKTAGQLANQPQSPAVSQPPVSDVSRLTTLGEARGGQAAARLPTEGMEDKEGEGAERLGPQHEQNADVWAWRSPGGLSLPADLPLAGNRLTFSKVGGDPKLAVGVRSGQSASTRLGLVWASLWLFVGLGVLLTARRQQACSSGIPWGLLILGLTCLYLLPNPLLGIVLFVCGALGLMWHFRTPVKHLRMKS
jgi:hypothetical protein